LSLLRAASRYLISFGGWGLEAGGWSKNALEERADLGDVALRSSLRYLNG
jgi:hypothetical protein